LEQYQSQSRTTFLDSRRQSDPTQLWLVFHTLTAQPAVKLTTNAAMSSAQTFTGSQNAHRVINGIQYYSSKVTASGLTEHKTYYYQYENNGAWSKPVAFATKSFTEFKLFLVGDPQIGASACNYTYNWNATLETALNAHPDVSFLISAGDQINYTKKDDTPQQEIEYSGFLSPKALKSLPLATTIGNHDALTTNYQNHFNNPNSFTAETTPTAAGHGYYFTYGSALFIVINTNNYNCADHAAVIKKAVQANPQSRWRILTFHQDIYGSGKDHSDSDGIILRTQLTPLIEKYHIDVVMQGHDHTYSRTYPISDDGLAHAKYSSNSDENRIKWSDEKTDAYLTQNTCYSVAKLQSSQVTNPKGAVYVSANSATGSKYYELINPMQDYIAARWQQWKPTYSVITITATRFTIDTYETETGSKIDATFTINKPLKKK
jgi:predicted phosphodiesterase